MAFAQIVKKGKGKVNNETFSYSFKSPEQEIKGLLILLPGWGETPRSIFEKTKLPLLLFEKGFVTVVPQLRQTLFADEFTIAQIKELIKIQKERYNSKELYLIIGGLSAGGAIALGYAEHVLKQDQHSKLKGVFAIDLPLDLVRIYKSAENKIKYTCQNNLIQKEGSFRKNYLLRAMNGSPQENLDQYLNYSVYSEGAKDGGNAKYLKTIPIRLFSEPDLDFVRKTYCSELQFEDLNAIDLEKLEKYLISIGNHKAEYFTSVGKGFHSWNIIDPVESTNWILKIV